MSNDFIRIVVLFCLVALISCSEQSNEQSSISENPTFGIWQDLPEPPIAFDLIQTFGDNEELMLPQSYRLQGPVTDQNSNLYVIDGQNGVLYSFDPDGNLRWEMGKKGRGPGDFEQPRGLVTDGEYLYTANVSGSRIDQFDMDGNFITSTSLESLDLNFNAVEGFLYDSLLVTSSTVMGQLARQVTLLNTKDNLNIVNQFKIESSSNTDLPEGLGYSFSIQVIDSLIAAGNIQGYKIHLFNSQGEKVKSITRDFDKLMRPGFVQSGSSRSIRGYGSLNAPIHLPSGFYLTTLSWPTNVDDPDRYLERSQGEDSNVPPITFKNSLDLYRSDGTLLYSLEEEGRTPSIGSLDHVDTQGNIYTKIDDPFPQIRKYAVTINSPENN